MKPFVCAILVNYNGYYDTKECVRSLLNCGYDHLHIFIVDNASKNEPVYYDEIITRIKCTIICLDKNFGFAGGNNIGIKAAQELHPDYFLIINNDTVVTKGFLDILVQTCESDKSAGIATGKIRYYDEQNLLWFGGSYFDTKLGEYRIDGIGCNDTPEYNIKKELSFATACLWLLPARVINHVGYMDESYFLYYEDADYCERLTKLGYRIIYNPQAEILHKESRSTKKESNLYIYYVNKNYMLYVLKYRQSNKYSYLLARIVRLTVKLLRKRIDWKLYAKILLDFITNKRGEAVWK